MNELALKCKMNDFKQMAYLGMAF